MTSVVVDLACPDCRSFDTEDCSDVLRAGRVARYCCRCDLVYFPAERLIPTPLPRRDLDD